MGFYSEACGVPQARIIADGVDYVVVNKPSGVQVPGTIDNVLESVGIFAAQAWPRV